MTTIVIGLDGANWAMLEDWLAAGDLPNLRRLIDTGVGGVAESYLPPLTVPNWKVYSTGRNPGGFDVFRFDRIDVQDREHVFHDATDFKSAELWDYLNDEGYTTGVVNKPSTYPPKDVDGFVVAGGPDATEREYRSLTGGYTNPPELEPYLVDALDYEVHPSPMISHASKGPEEVEAVLDLIDTRFETAEHLLDREDPDFLHLTVFYNMALQHYFWRDEPVRRAWERIDDNLGRFVDEGHDLVVVSDHGTEPVEAVFYVNIWLAQRGYLALECSVMDALQSLGITRERALAAAQRLGIVDFLSATVPERLQKLVPWNTGAKGEQVLSLVDWDRTRAVASSQGPIYLTASPSDPDYERLRGQLIEALTDLHHPETGRRLVDAVHRGEVYYDGPFADDAPDLLVEQAPGVHTSDAVGTQEWYSDDGVWRGGNMPEGVFLFNGPSFREEGLGRRARLVDVAPTILHAMGAPVPTTMDGEVLDVFAAEHDDRPVRTRPPLGCERASSDAGRTEVEERLADLGYLE